jgi:hypothetical protein
VISVTPDSLSVTLQQGQMESRVLTIANLGGTTLTWDQFGGPGCVLPSQWVSALPFGGSIPPGQSQELTVTFDATNVLSGTYTATLCLTSNDPVTPMVTVPLTLTVTAGEGTRILFNQSLFFAGQTGSEAGAPTQRLVPPGALDAEGADDFPIPDQEGWTISEFNFELRLGDFGLFATELPVLDIRVYPGCHCRNRAWSTRVFTGCPCSGVTVRYDGPLLVLCHLPSSTVKMLVGATLATGSGLGVLTGLILEPVLWTGNRSPVKVLNNIYSKCAAP